MKVTAIVKAAKPGYAADGGNLFLQISKGGSASWVLRYRIDGRLREMGLGALHTITLAEARDEATAIRKKLKAFRDGKIDLDPLAEKRAKLAQRKAEAAKAMTFKQCGDAYFKTHQAEWRNPKHVTQWRSSLDAYVYPLLGGLAVEAIDTGLVAKVLEQPVDAGGGKKGQLWTTRTETASRVRGRIEMILDWAKVRGYRTGENPARWRGHLDQMLPKPAKAKKAVRVATGRPEHFVAMPYDDVPAFMVELRELDAVAAYALELTILTATRTSEVLGARWDEIDMANWLWAIPSTRMKAGKEHRVPLSDAAIAILSKMLDLRSGDYVFPGRGSGKPLGNMAMNMMLRRMKRDDLTVHGFRSTFSDWCAEQTAFASEVREMALAHTVGDKVEAAYRRGDLFEKRRQLAEAWAKFCARPAAGGDNVVALREQGAGR
ncbi:MAG TPA: tyrosine-type recombinase/integrase [Stellaceae bacterium]|nr:tyrosine-type recombinase/integrase [Stellaceae bacterium]